MSSILIFHKRSKSQAYLVKLAQQLMATFCGEYLLYNVEWRREGNHWKATFKACKKEATFAFLSKDAVNRISPYRKANWDVLGRPIGIY